MTQDGLDAEGESIQANMPNTTMSQTAKTILLGALIATAGLWIFAMTAAMGYVTFRM
jgi:hypothetical protein